MKHEYTFEELAELRKSTTNRAKPVSNSTKCGRYARPDSSRRAYRRNRRNETASSRTAGKRIDQGQPFDGKETAEALGLSPKTVGNILGQLRKEGLLPAFDQHSPRKTRKTTTTGKKKETMTVTSKPAANKEEPMSQELTANAVTAPEKEREHTRAAITDALVYIYDAISALQKTAFQTNDKVVYGFATKLLNGELMDLKANYSKDVAK